MDRTFRLDCSEGAPMRSRLAQGGAGRGKTFVAKHEISEAIVRKKINGKSLAQIAVHLMSKGVLTVPSTLMTAWVAGTVNGEVGCVMCAAAAGAVFRCVMKIGLRWFNVTLKVGDVTQHAFSTSGLADIEKKMPGVVIEYEHAVCERVVGAQLIRELEVERAVRWTFRLFRADRIGVDPVVTSNLKVMAEHAVRRVMWNVDEAPLVMGLMRVFEKEDI